MTPLTHRQEHAASLTHEQRHEVRNTVLWWMALPFLMLMGSVAIVFLEQAESNRHLRDLAEQQLETSRRVELDTIRSELSDIDHRIKQEECLIRPFGQVIRRDPAVPCSTLSGSSSGRIRTWARRSVS